MASKLRILASPLTRRIRAAQARFHAWGQRRAAAGEVSARLYYAFANDALSREARAVAAGQRRYYADLKGDQGNLFLMRRNIHRVEKGLIMRPRRAVFAEGYIGETVTAYARAVAGGAPASELKWATDVLDQYFAAVDASAPTIGAAKAAFEAVPRPAPGANALHAPYRRDLAAPPPVGYESMMALARRRRSVRWFLDTPVPREAIDRAMDVAVQAPSACNRQPYQFRIYEAKDDIRRIASIAMGTKGFVEGMPVLAVLVGQLRAYPYERDRHAIYIDASLAAMSFAFALETMGLASCMINWPDQEPQETRMREAVGLEDDERVVMLIAFGHPDPDGMVPYSAKRPLDMARIYASAGEPS